MKQIITIRDSWKMIQGEDISSIFSTVGVKKKFAYFPTKTSSGWVWLLHYYRLTCVDKAKLPNIKLYIKRIKKADHLLLRLKGEI